MIWVRPEDRQMMTCLGQEFIGSDLGLTNKVDLQTTDSLPPLLVYTSRFFSFIKTIYCHHLFKCQSIMLLPSSMIIWSGDFTLQRQVAKWVCFAGCLGLTLTMVLRYLDSGHNWKDTLMQTQTMLQGNTYPIWPENALGSFMKSWRTWFWVTLLPALTWTWSINVKWINGTFKKSTRVKWWKCLV